MNEILDSILEQANNHTITLERLVLLQLVIGAMLLVYYVLGKRLLKYLFEKGVITDTDKRKLLGIIRICFFLIALLLGVIILSVNIGIPQLGSTLCIANAIIATLIIQIARLFDYFFGRVVKRFYEGSEHKEERSPDQERNSPTLIAGQTIKYAIYTLAIIIILKNLELDYELFSFNAGSNIFHFRISSIFSAVLILLVARLLIWMLTHILLSSYYTSRKVDIGSRYAINQLITYFVYVIASVMALDNMGIQMTVLWGGLAALLVGVGLGLQQTFNDLFSGILLLFERTVEVGNVVEIDGKIGTVKKIGLRTSLIESRDSITFIVPNSKLVMNSIVNWTHYDSMARYKIKVGVAYGSNTIKVRELLLSAAVHPQILKRPAPLVQFIDFGNSSLDFELFFFSRNFVASENIKSDLRFEIDRLFREHKIEIPFPQRDVWIRSKE